MAARRILSAVTGEPDQQDARGGRPSGSPEIPGPLPARIGIIAGGGRFPILVAEGARRRGIQVVAIGFRHATSPEVFELSEAFKYTGLARIGTAIRFFKRHGVREVAFAGWIRKEKIFRPWRIFSLLPDWRTLRLWYFRLRNRQDQTILSAIAAEFEGEGIHVADSTKYCPELLAEEGVLTRRGPSRAQLADIRFGWKVARRMADLDVGQSVVVSEKSTLAVEGIEGTDRNIRRAGDLCRRGGFTVVKLAKEGHDMRFDIPAIGPDTIDSIHAARGAVLAVEAGRTMIIDRESTLEKANRLGIVVVVYREPPAEA
ncbi:MAG TPA: UDP-2,3-diacylglucosamine diphosphatase LpxI [Planctomycetota bacterium]|nr:UDP-2,3-diacylglucosamine diphosphatase LpxI [Planctomycetota bacterium]